VVVPPETCRAVSRQNKLCNVASCWTYIRIKKWKFKLYDVWLLFSVNPIWSQSAYVLRVIEKNVEFYCAVLRNMQLYYDPHVWTVYGSGFLTAVVEIRAVDKKKSM
jgi:hypothetical protein